jgi:hypothetical protein
MAGEALSLQPTSCDKACPDHWGIQSPVSLSLNAQVEECLQSRGTG